MTFTWDRWLGVIILFSTFFGPGIMSALTASNFRSELEKEINRGANGAALVVVGTFLGLFAEKTQGLTLNVQRGAAIAALVCLIYGASAFIRAINRTEPLPRGLLSWTSGLPTLVCGLGFIFAMDGYFNLPDWVPDKRMATLFVVGIGALLAANGAARSYIVNRPRGGAKMPIPEGQQPYGGAKIEPWKNRQRRG
jgi:hypothetical protein